MRRALMAVIRKEFRQTFRDPRMLAILVVAPIFQLTVLGYAVELDVDNIATAVCDQDRSPASRRLVEGMTADGTLERAFETDDPLKPLPEGRATAVVVIPAGYGKDLTHGRPVHVQLLVDGSDPLRSQAAEAAVTQFLFVRGARTLIEKRAVLGALKGVELSSPSIIMEPRVMYNPRMRSPTFMVPGIAAILLLIVTTIVTAMGIAREQELGTIEQLLITPMKPIVLLLGKILPFSLIGVVVTGVVLAVGTNLFDVPIRGPLGLLLVATILYLLSTLGVGVLISTAARTQQQAMLGALFFLMPAILLSGFATPVEGMPGWLQPVTWFNPVFYFVKILRAVLLKGAGLADLWPDLTALFVFGGVIMAVAALRFRRQLA